MTNEDLTKKAQEAIEAALRAEFPTMGDELLKPLASIRLNSVLNEAAKATEPKTTKELTTKSIQLDFWDDGKRAAPSAVFRSALFPVINPKQKENRVFLENKKLGSVSGVTVFFTGKQFDQTDLDIYLELLNLAKPLPVGEPVKFSAHGLLKALGIPTGGSNHKRLHSVLIRLCGGVVDMTDHKKRYFGQLLHGGIREELTNHYQIKLNPDFAQFFNGLWSSVDKEQRHALGRNLTAKALHSYYSSHAAPTAHKYETLAELLGLSNRNKRQLKADIIKAHEALKAIGFLSGFEATAEGIKPIINQSPSQIKYIVKQASKPKRKN